MNKIALIFPGQGAQSCGMGKEFYDQTETGKMVFDTASQLLGFSMTDLCFTENPKLHMTEYTQAAMVTVEIAMCRVLKEHGITPNMTAGLSLGEYSALEAAGAMDWQSAITTVRQRGILMEEAVPAGEGAMAAVLSLDVSEIEKITGEMDGVWIANYNCPGQTVISGRKEAVEKACEKLQAAGARKTVFLNVSGPFHSGLLEEAGKKLGKVLENTEFSRPEIPYVSNVTASFVTEKEEIPSLLIKQVSSSVRWQQSVEAMIKAGADTFIEIGPGKTLSGFMKKINRNVSVWNIETMEDVKKVASAIKKEN